MRDIWGNMLGEGVGPASLKGAKDPLIYPSGVVGEGSVDVYVGNTDGEWFDFLSERNLSEVNFWKPGGGAFKALKEGDMFLFRLKAERGGLIAGGGFFVDAPVMTIDWAWRAFGPENGVGSMRDLNDRIWRYKSYEGRRDPNADVTCIILNDVFYFEDADRFGISDRWSRYIVSGKTFRGQEAAALVDEVRLRLAGIGAGATLSDADAVPVAPPGVEIVSAKHRLGQGAFRTLVANAYQRRCAITGERSMPVLQAAHIQSFSEEGPNSVDNGILMRSDMHALFDSGYLTIDYDLMGESRILVSDRLHDDFGNGKDYYPYHGRRLAVMPERRSLRPAKRYLDWHHENVFLG